MCNLRIPGHKPSQKWSAQKQTPNDFMRAFDVLWKCRQVKDNLLRDLYHLPVTFGGMVDCCKEISFWITTYNIYIIYRIISSSKSLWTGLNITGWKTPFTSCFLFSLSKLQAPTVSISTWNQDTCTRRSSPAVLKTCGKEASSEIRLRVFYVPYLNL